MNVRTVCRDEKRLVVVERTPLVKVRLYEVVFFSSMVDRMAWPSDHWNPSFTSNDIIVCIVS